MQSTTISAPIAHASAPQNLEQNRFNERLGVYVRRRNAVDDMSPDDDDQVNDATDALVAAAERVISTPAVTLMDVRAKLEVLFDDDTLPVEGTDLNEVFDDLARLTGNATSPTFDAERWLVRFQNYGGGWVERDGEVVLLYPDRVGMETCRWLLETRNGLHAVKAAILARSAAQEA